MTFFYYQIFTWNDRFSLSLYMNYPEWSFVQRFYNFDFNSAANERSFRSAQCRCATRNEWNCKWIVWVNDWKFLTVWMCDGNKLLYRIVACCLKYAQCYLYTYLQQWNKLWFDLCVESGLFAQNSVTKAFLKWRPSGV